MRVRQNRRDAARQSAVVGDPVEERPGHMGNHCRLRNMAWGERSGAVAPRPDSIFIRAGRQASRKAWKSSTAITAADALEEPTGAVRRRALRTVDDAGDFAGELLPDGVDQEHGAVAEDDLAAAVRPGDQEEWRAGQAFSDAAGDQFAILAGVPQVRVGAQGADLAGARRRSARAPARRGQVRRLSARAVRCVSRRLSPCSPARRGRTG